jgi:NitT/TauT family transport system permease protein
VAHDDLADAMAMTNAAQLETPVETAARQRARRSSARYLPVLTTPLIVVALLVAWQGYVSLSGVSKFILPAPVSVWNAWMVLLASPKAWAHLWTTVGETSVGFIWGTIVGVALGIVIGRLRWLEVTLTPFIIATQVVPKVAFVPLFVVWFGFGPTSKVIVAAVLAFFPILSNAVLGTKSVDAGHRDVMTSLNATPWQIFRRLELPSALPLILTGMEVGIVLAFIGAIVGEYLGGNSGLGFLMIARMNAYETDGLFAVMVQMSLLGFVFYLAIGALRRVLIRWHPSAFRATS